MGKIVGNNWKARMIRLVEHRNMTVGNNSSYEWEGQAQGKFTNRTTNKVLSHNIRRNSACRDKVEIYVNMQMRTALSEGVK